MSEAYGVWIGQPYKDFPSPGSELMTDFRAERLRAVERVSCCLRRSSLKMWPLAQSLKKKSSLVRSGKDVLHGQRGQRCEKEPQRREKINDRFHCYIQCSWELEMWSLSKYKTHGRASVAFLFLAFCQVVLEVSISCYVTEFPFKEPGAKMKSRVLWYIGEEQE